MKYILVLFAILFLWTANTHAGNQSGEITKLTVRSDGLHWVQLEGQHNSKPQCATSQEYWMIKDENTQAGKSQISILLTAYASGRPVSISGLNTCTRWGDGEDIDTVTAAQ